uniref:Uncharacterized protein n=1 Tax=Rhizophora mucronata TaxID=61149 RepID=A0A2P2MLF2_RHIMU
MFIIFLNIGFRNIQWQCADTARERDGYQSYISTGMEHKNRSITISDLFELKLLEVGIEYDRAKSGYSY